MIKQHNSRLIYLIAVFLLSSLVIVLMVGVLGASGPFSELTTASNIYAGDPDWIGQSDKANSWYGESVRSAGDVNGDGYQDAIVGAVNYDALGYSDSGRAYLYYGSPNGLSQTPDRIFEPPQLATSGFFGGMATTAGNVDGDEYDDIIISMVNYDSTYSDEGAVFVWYGSDTGPANNYDWMARGDATYAHLGWDVGTAGDINNDGYDDIIVGAYQYDSGSISHAYVWYGSDTGLGATGTPSNADWSASTDQNCGGEEAACSGFGSRVGTAGDVNGDTYDDIWVGAPRYDSGQTDEGKVFVWYGTEDGPISGTVGLPNNASWTAETDQAYAYFTGYDRSYMVSGGDTAGDINGDGYSDIILGAYHYDNGQEDEGAAFVWLGSEDGLNGGINGNPGNADWFVESNQENGFLGIEVSTAGDFNGDSYDDVLVGAWNYKVINSETYTGAGQLMLWFGSESGLGTGGTPANADWTARGDQSYGYLGFSVDSLGDVEKDGCSDVIGGAPTYDRPENAEGVAFAFYSSSITGLNAVSDVPVIQGASATFTASVATGCNVTYDWDFGDELTGTGEIAMHTYSTTGVHNVVVTATSQLTTASYNFTVDVFPTPIDGLQAFNSSPTLLGETTYFTATVSAGTEIEYEWDFGDTYTASGQYVSHVYDEAKAYSVSVTASNRTNSQFTGTIVEIESNDVYIPFVIKSD